METGTAFRQLVSGIIGATLDGPKRPAGRRASGRPTANGERRIASLKTRDAI